LLKSEPAVGAAVVVAAGALVLVLGAVVVVVGAAAVDAGAAPNALAGLEASEVALLVVGFPRPENMELV
jgi:hypothetical protein